MKEDNPGTKNIEENNFVWDRGILCRLGCSSSLHV